MTVANNSKRRNPRRKPQRQGKKSPKPNNQPRKPKKRRQGGVDKVYSEFGECGVLFAKALQDPFHYVNGTTKLPCVPAGPKVKTERYVSYFNGTMSSGANGNGFIMVAPYKICSDANVPTVYHTASAFSGDRFATGGGGVISANLPNPSLTRANNPSYRVVACGLRLTCIGPNLYRGGRTGYSQLPNVTDTWSGRFISELFTQPDALSHPVDTRTRTYSWKFGSTLPMAVVSEQNEFMNSADFDAYEGHCMGLSITGAQGAGAGLPFQWEVVLITEVQSRIVAGLRTTSTAAVFSETSLSAAQHVPAVIQRARGEVTDMNLKDVVEAVSGVMNNDLDLTHVKNLAHSLGNFHRVGKIDL